MTDTRHSPDWTLGDGSRIGVIGSGPAGSFFSYFLFDLAHRTGIDLEVDLYESRDFTRPAPQGCNMCGGIISETLVQNLATEGINLPASIIQRGLDSYVLHMDVGSVRIETPLHEKRIGAIHRGPGPRDVREIKWESFDGYLQRLAMDKGARRIQDRVTAYGRTPDGRPRVTLKSGNTTVYDLLAVAVGVNSPALKLFESEVGYRPPRSVKTFIREYYLGKETVDAVLGNSMHIFLLNLPRLEFAAFIPKGEYASLCLLGDDIDKELVTRFLESPEVTRAFPVRFDPAKGSCQCSPRINVDGALHPYADRLVFLGDAGVTRLYKDGIGAAYRTAKAAAATAVLHGVSERHFREHYAPLCRSIAQDNRLGKFAFAVTRGIQQRRFARRAVLDMTSGEQKGRAARRMSGVLWDMFTGSSPYRSIVLRSLHPAFLGRLAWNSGASLLRGRE